MHPEIGYISEAAALEINETKSRGNRVIAVGTTALRLIESAAEKNGVVSAWSGKTDIFIYPGFKFKVADGLMTNFHLPKSTLLMLVSALMGVDRIKKIYEHAITEKYRFFHSLHLMAGCIERRASLFLRISQICGRCTLSSGEICIP